ncbi:exonuclease sbcCD subunit D [Vagococcus penaei]|uniref:Nuclease SbcCD subunit D n=1 Tax=Vagococcus penaei TaxID=633807 RepID=A0A1Q2D523_9ENTE|nr:exonuclease SbcCD subunit D [Vagococcus penaei]AQP53506.1 exonuclease sbcCD subunit D [Vagococcus penaei]RSU07450.1 exonuclease sbcCD subunit D [Vagococcus penaei]
MKFLHTADWHIGRKLNGFSLLEEQKAAFDSLMQIAQTEEVDAIIIAGDLYDRTVPSVEAVGLFHQMMIEMNMTAKLPVFAISGNHDSRVRLEVGAPWLKSTQFYLHTQLEQAFEPIDYQSCQLYLLPYFEPFHARAYFGRDDIRTIEQAMTLVIDKIKQTFDPTKKHLLVTHFFVQGALKSDTETPLEVGGLDNVPANLFAEFDYVALGHLHYFNAIRKLETIKYSGALLKYSLSECGQEKGVRLVEIGDEVTSRFIPISPIRDVVHLTGQLGELLDPDFYQAINREDYIGITLTDTAVVDDSLGQLRAVYPRLISLERAVKSPTDNEVAELTITDVSQLNPEHLTKQYFETMTDKILTVQQEAWLSDAISQTLKER